MTTSHVNVTSAHPGTPASTVINADYLDSLQLIQLEWSFRQWVKMTSRYETRLARRRALIVFLLMRYSGATLEEVLSLNLENDLTERAILIRDVEKPQRVVRKIPLVEHIADEIRESLLNPDIYFALTDADKLKPTAVRHTFYQRAEACGFTETLCSPEKIRVARVMELQRAGVSPAKIEQLLGCVTSAKHSPHSGTLDNGCATPVKHIFERIRGRNNFAGKIVELQRDAFQSQVVLCTQAGHHITAIVSNDSADRLVLQPGSLITVEVKPHAISLQTNSTYASSSIDNCFAGEIVGITRGRVSWECVVNIGGGTDVYSLNSVHYAVTLGLKVGKKVWATFNSFAAILRVT
ncbi:MAG: TOBE domain-containing protein [Desulfobulbus sp.]|nr:TOBE domain-containing protein [Desulfobulbus sp.]